MLLNFFMLNSTYHDIVYAIGHSVSAASVDIGFAYKQRLINSDLIYI